MQSSTKNWSETNLSYLSESEGGSLSTTHLKTVLSCINADRDGTNGCHGILEGSLTLGRNDLVVRGTVGANVRRIEMTLLILKVNVEWERSLQVSF